MASQCQSLMLQYVSTAWIRTIWAGSSLIVMAIGTTLCKSFSKINQLNSCLLNAKHAQTCMMTSTGTRFEVLCFHFQSSGVRAILNLSMNWMNCVWNQINNSPWSWKCFCNPTFRDRILRSKLFFSLCTRYLLHGYNIAFTATIACETKLSDLTIPCVTDKCCVLFPLLLGPLRWS